MPAAVLWDLDGTLVDTEPSWIAAEFDLATRHGATWSEEDALNLVGSPLIDSGRYIREHMGLALSPEEIVAELLDAMVASVRTSADFRPGAVELLGDLRADGMPCALVTMSYRRLVDAVLVHLPPDSFDAIITGDEVTHGKPHPEPYLAAATALAVNPRACLAIEDSPKGALSASAAGCRVLVVENRVPVPLRDGWQVTDSLLNAAIR